MDYSQYDEQYSERSEENKGVELTRAGSSLSTKKEAGFSDDFFEEGEGQLTIDVYQTPNEIVVESPIAGVKPEDLDIAITNESVTIKGKRARERKVSEEDYFYQECYWGKFSRSVILPQEVDAENAEATIANGVLIIKMPKLDRQRSRKLQVKIS